MTTYRILGPIEVWKGGVRVPVGGPRQLKLLAFLLLHANRAVSTDAVIEAIWGSSASASISRVHMAIARLRRALEPLQENEEVLRTVSGGYLLSVAPHAFDASVFARKIDDGRRLLDGGDPARATEILTAALELWRGAPFAEVAFEDFAHGEIRHLEEMRLLALETQTEAELQLGHHSDLIGKLERLHAEQPTRERIASQLMLALYRSGRQAEALEVYQSTRARLVEDLGLEPGPTLTTLHRSILNHHSSLTAGESRSGTGALARIEAQGNAARFPWSGGRISPPPAPSTAIIGRSTEIDLVASMLSDSSIRLVTLTGPGGVGKTRLAAEVARTAGECFADGVCWVELAGVDRADNVPSTVIQALAITQMEHEGTINALVRNLRNTQLLLVIDNFEHVLDATALVAELLAKCPAVTVLSTSREMLKLSGEHRVVVAPLEVPINPDHVSLAEVDSNDATVMFATAARRLDHNFAVSRATAQAVAQICARLDGLPLALELAAARTAFTSLRELAKELTGALAELGDGHVDAPTRHNTLEATINWSYQLLPPQEQLVFARFSVFSGGAPPAAAADILPASRQTLESLCAKSLLVPRHSENGDVRLVMLDTIRAYASDRAQQDATLALVKRRHLAYHLALVESATAKLSTHNEADAVACLDTEADNIRSAVEWALEAVPADGLKLIGRLGDYWQIRPEANALSLLNRALLAVGAPGDPKDRGQVQLLRARQLAAVLDDRGSMEATDEALALFEEADDAAGTTRALIRRANLRDREGEAELSHADIAAAHRYALLAGGDALIGGTLARLSRNLPPDKRDVAFEEASQLLIRAGDYRQLAIVSMNVAYQELREGRIDQATRLLDLAASAATRTPTPATTMFLAGNRGLASLFSGDTQQARVEFSHQLRLCLEHAFRLGAGEGLAGVAAVEAHVGHDELAALLLGAAHTLGYPDPFGQAIYSRIKREFYDPAQARHGPQAWSNAEQAGRALPYRQAIERALAIRDGTLTTLPES